MEDADEVERDVSIGGGAYCGIGATSGVGGGCVGGFCVYATVACAEGTPCAYIDGRGGSGITPLV